MDETAAARIRPGERNCPRCGAVFVCGNEVGAAACWCAELPPLLPLPGPGKGQGCYCPDCLRALLGRQAQSAQKS
jgi:hypothetical protein